MRELTIEIPIDEGQLLGANIDSKHIIVQVQANTVADGQLQIGDRVTKIKLTVEREDELPAPATLSSDERAQPSVTSSIRADLNLSAIPEERLKSVPHRSGFVYEIVDVVIKKGERLGLHLCSYQNRVVVANTLPKSVSAMHLKRGDHIIDVNGARVGDKMVASNFITESLNKTKKVSLLIARPSTPATRQEMEDDIVRKLDPPSKVMPPDVLEICAKERERMRAEVHENVLPSIVVDPNTRLPQTVTIKEARNQVVLIPADNPLLDNADAFTQHIKQ